VHTFWSSSDENYLLCYGGVKLGLRDVFREETIYRVQEQSVLDGQPEEQCTYVKVEILAKRCHDEVVTPLDIHVSGWVMMALCASERDHTSGAVVHGLELHIGPPQGKRLAGLIVCVAADREGTGSNSSHESQNPCKMLHLVPYSPALRHNEFEKPSQFGSAEVVPVATLNRNIHNEIDMTPQAEVEKTGNVRKYWSPLLLLFG
jgi:hypothetical protein